MISMSLFCYRGGGKNSGRGAAVAGDGRWLTDALKICGDG
jgi:hypothetical protein